MPLAASPALSNWFGISRIQRIRSQHEYFVAVGVTIAIGIAFQGVGSNGSLLYIEKLVAIHVGNCAYRIAALEGLAVEQFAGDADALRATRITGKRSWVSGDAR